MYVLVSIRCLLTLFTIMIMLRDSASPYTIRGGYLISCSQWFLHRKPDSLHSNHRFPSETSLKYRVMKVSTFYLGLNI